MALTKIPDADRSKGLSRSERTLKGMGLGGCLQYSSHEEVLLPFPLDPLPRGGTHG